MNQSYLMSQKNAGLGEGTGPLGMGTSFSFRGSFSVFDNILRAHGIGSCGLMALSGSERPTIKFSETAILIKNNVILERQRFSRMREAIISPGWNEGIFVYIGNVDFVLHDPEDMTPLILQLEGRCVIDMGHGSIFPPKGTVQEEFTILVEKI
jgi:hypothetical protein